MDDHITHDKIYNTVDRDDFKSMLDLDRYGDRTDAFDGIISATVAHFWDPNDERYIDFNQPFDITASANRERIDTIGAEAAGIGDRLIGLSE